MGNKKDTHANFFSHGTFVQFWPWFKLVHFLSLAFNIVHHQVKGVLEAFLRMSDDLQYEYLQLANKYDEHPSQWSEYSRQLFAIKQEQVQGLELTALSEETANRVWQIQETNSFQNGVFLKIARFNHSCCPNAEFSWVQKIGRREVLNKFTKYFPTKFYQLFLTMHLGEGSQKNSKG